MEARAELYSRYPLWSVFLYNGSTILHFLLGATGIILGYLFSPTVAWVAGLSYLTLALSEMYVLMPLVVCPSCVYYRLDDSLCVSGLNLFSRKVAAPRDPADFPMRGQGILCSNNLYIAALVVPIVALIPALFVNFSFALLLIFLTLVGLLLFRFFFLFPKVACLHCRAKFLCPQAGAMGVREL